MNTPTIGKLMGGFVVGAAAAIGALAAGRAPANAEAAPAQPTISAPAATTADIAALREHFDKRFDVQQSQVNAVATDLAGVKGYLRAQAEARK